MAATKLPQVPGAGRNQPAPPAVAINRADQGTADHWAADHGEAIELPDPELGIDIQFAKAADH